MHDRNVGYVAAGECRTQLRVVVTPRLTPDLLDRDAVVLGVERILDDLNHLAFGGRLRHVGDTGDILSAVAEEPSEAQNDILVRAAGAVGARRLGGTVARRLGGTVARRLGGTVAAGVVAAACGRNECDRHQRQQQPPEMGCRI